MSQQDMLEGVLTWYMDPAGATFSMMSLRPPYAPTGSPPPIILPSVVRSGLMPKYCCAPPWAILQKLLSGLLLFSSLHQVRGSKRHLLAKFEDRQGVQLTAAFLVGEMSSFFPRRLDLISWKDQVSKSKLLGEFYLNPVMTSSKQSRASFCFVTSLRPCNRVSFVNAQQLNQFWHTLLVTMLTLYEGQNMW